MFKIFKIPFKSFMTSVYIFSSVRTYWKEFVVVTDWKEFVKFKRLLFQYQSSNTKENILVKTDHHYVYPIQLSMRCQYTQRRSCHSSLCSQQDSVPSQLYWLFSLTSIQSPWGPWPKRCVHME